MRRQFLLLHVCVLWEISDGLNLCLRSALRKYHELNQTLPERILVFRDGVGDEQMATVLEFEIPQMIKCFSMFGEGIKVRDAIVVELPNIRWIKSLFTIRT